MTTTSPQLNENWLYSTNRLNLRSESLRILLRTYGSHLLEDGTPEHSTESIYACAHDWVSQGNPTTDGIIDYYNKNYDRSTDNGFGNQGC